MLSANFNFKSIFFNSKNKLSKFISFLYTYNSKYNNNHINIAVLQDEKLQIKIRNLNS